MITTGEDFVCAHTARSAPLGSLMKRAEMPHRALLQLALALVGVAHGGEFQGDDGGPPGSGPPPEPPVGCYSGDGTDYEGGARFTVSGKPCLKWDVIVWTTSYADLPGNFCRNPDGEPWPWCFYGPDAEDWEQCDVPVCPSAPSPPSSPPLPPPPPPPPPPPSAPPHPPDKAPLPPPPSQPPPSPPPVGCYEGDGANYEGGAVLTVSGALCREWALGWATLNEPNGGDANGGDSANERVDNTYNGDDDDDSSYVNYGGPQNFCRNLGNKEVSRQRPWCYLTNASSPEEWQYCDIPACPSPSPPPSPAAPPAAPPGLCMDTCNGQVGGAQVGICDDGVGRQDGVAGICQPGTDCSDCGVREFASPLLGAPVACYRQALAAGTHACLQSMLGNGVCDAGCNTADCGFDGFNSSKLPVAFGDCGRAKIEESCVQAMYESSRDYTTLPAQVNVSMGVGRFDVFVGSEGLLKMGFRLDVSMQWTSPSVQRTECGYALPHLLSVGKHEISSRASLIEEYAKSLLFLPTPVIAGEVEAAHWPRSIVKSDYSARYEASSVTYNETLDFQLGFRTNYKYFPFDQHDLALIISIPGVPLSTGSCDGIVEALRDSAGGGLANILPLDKTWLPAMNLGMDELISRTDTHLVGSCRIRIRVRRNSTTFALKKASNPYAHLYPYP